MKSLWVPTLVWIAAALVALLLAFAAPEGSSYLEFEVELPQGATAPR